MYTKFEAKHIEIIFPGGSIDKRNRLQCRRPGFIPWVGKISWRRDDNSLQYSRLENPMNKGARRAAVHGVPKELDTTEGLTPSHRDYFK